MVCDDGEGGLRSLGVDEELGNVLVYELRW